jgi:hypothetical protein
MKWISKGKNTKYSNFWHEINDTQKINQKYSKQYGDSEKQSLPWILSLWRRIFPQYAKNFENILSKQ